MNTCKSGYIHIEAMMNTENVHSSHKKNGQKTNDKHKTKI